MVEIEIRMKILTVRKQFGNLNLIFKIDTYAELKHTSEFQSVLLGVQKL